MFLADMPDWRMVRRVCCEHTEPQNSDANRPVDTTGSYQPLKDVWRV